MGGSPSEFRAALGRAIAGNYITKLPKAEHDAPEWQAAMEAQKKCLQRKRSNET
jgi:hypothetical protein